MSACVRDVYVSLAQQLFMQRRDCLSSFYVKYYAVAKL
jgi:hypothetical protein